MKYERHIFVCTNQREGGKECCGEQTGMELVNCFKNLIKDNQMQKTVRAQRAGCFDTCSDGAAVVVYPEGIFYGKVKPEDVEEIFREHIQEGRPVERLRLKF
jgi:(2Fe-2S) ferredoxin